MPIIGIDLVGALGPPLDPQGAPEHPPWPPPRGPYVLEGLLRTAQRLPSTCRPSLFCSFGRPRPLQRTRLSRKATKTNCFLTISKSQLRRQFITSAPFGLPRAPSGPFWERRGAPFGALASPKGSSMASLELMGRAEDPLRLDHHWVIATEAAFGRTSKNSFFTCKNNTFSE